MARGMFPVGAMKVLTMPGRRRRLPREAVDGQIEIDGQMGGVERGMTWEGPWFRHRGI